MMGNWYHIITPHQPRIFVVETSSLSVSMMMDVTLTDFCHGLLATTATAPGWLGRR
jgi:hypothetical protein